MRIKHLFTAVAIVAVGSLGLSACGGSPAEKESGSGELTMWVRPTAGEPVEKMVALWNETNTPKIKVTTVPGDAFQQKVGAAAGSNSLPDLLGSDVVYSPNYVDQGIYQDITELANGLPYKENLAQAHQEAASKDGKIYALPLIVDSSLIIYNKTLYEKAGLDPEAPPTNFDEIYEQAKAVRALGGDTYGFYFAGNCAGCSSYTMMPYAAADGTPPLKDGTVADINSPALNEMADLYGKMFAEDLVPSGAKTDDGATWPASFNAGKIGILPVGTFNFANLADVDFEWGITQLPAPDGSATSTFVGGDVIGISRNAKDVEGASAFLEWILSDDPQLEVLAKNGFLTPRFDLADNKYTAEKPHVIATIEGLKYGYTPSTLPYGEIFNSGTGPWLQGLRSHIFDGNTEALADAQVKIQKIIDEAK